MSVRETFAQVAAERDEATSPDVEAAQPAVETEAPPAVEHAPDAALEQPAADEGSFSDDDFAQAESLLVDAFEESQNGSESGVGITPGSDDFWNLDVDVKTADGQQTITVREAADGYMRQDDYTRKTQALAEKSKRLDRAEQFLNEFESNPQQFARSLAIQAGWITADDQPVAEFQAAKIPTPDELNERVNAMVEERVANDQRVKDAEVAAARAEISQTFDQLSVKYKVPLSERVRDSILKEAVDTGNSDLEGILTRRLVQANVNAGSADALRAAATARPGSQPPVEETPGPTDKSLSIKELYGQVKAEQATQ